MLCENCQKETASVHVTKIINGQKTEIHICQDCAQDIGEIGLNIDLPNFFASLFDHSHHFGETVTRSNECPTCHLTLSDFRRINQFGCSDCYSTFRKDIDPLLRRLHGSQRHEGKVPEKGYQALSVDRKIKLLRERLQAEVEAENYEEAAKIRDEIRDLARKPLKKEGEASE